MFVGAGNTGIYGVYLLLGESYRAMKGNESVNRNI
jgi:hypothetical protein